MTRHNDGDGAPFDLEKFRATDEDIKEYDAARRALKNQKLRAQPRRDLGRPALVLSCGIQSRQSFV